MRYREVQPCAELSHLVRYFWVIEHSESDGHPVPFRLFAESCPGLVFFCRSGYAAISGVTTTSHSFTISGSFKMIGAYFYPYALPLLFHIPAKEFTEKQIALSDLAPRDARTLADQMMNTADTEKQLRTISDFIKQRTPFHSLTGVHAGVRQLMSTHGNSNIEQVASVSNLSLRQLERRFYDEVGVSPKLLSRLIRHCVCRRARMFRLLTSAYRLVITISLISFATLPPLRASHPNNTSAANPPGVLIISFSFNNVVFIQFSTPEFPELA
jgi:AraC-like DNA-binding protein